MEIYFKTGQGLTCVWKKRTDVANLIKFIVLFAKISIKYVIE